MHIRVTFAHARVAAVFLVGALVATAALVGVTGGANETALLASMLLGAALLVAGSGSVALAGRRAGGTLRMPLPSRGCSGHVEAPSAYWCVVPAPARPRLPRAPGRG